jgi:hypothetical protein
MGMYVQNKELSTRTRFLYVNDEDESSSPTKRRTSVFKTRTPVSIKPRRQQSHLANGLATVLERIAPLPINKRDESEGEKPANSRDRNDKIPSNSATHSPTSVMDNIFVDCPFPAEECSSSLTKPKDSQRRAQDNEEAITPGKKNAMEAQLRHVQKALEHAETEEEKAAATVIAAQEALERARERLVSAKEDTRALHNTRVALVEKLEKTDANSLELFDDDDDQCPFRDCALCEHVPLVDCYMVGSVLCGSNHRDDDAVECHLQFVLPKVLPRQTLPTLTLRRRRLSLDLTKSPGGGLVLFSRSPARLSKSPKPSKRQSD